MSGSCRGGLRVAGESAPIDLAVAANANVAASIDAAVDSAHPKMPSLPDEIGEGVALAGLESDALLDEVSN